MNALKPIHSPKLPFQKEIRGVFPGRLIYIYGTVPSDSQRFAVNLTNGDDVIFHLNPRVKENVVVRNSKLSNQWGREERDGGMPFKAGDKFDIKIIIKKKVIAVFVNSKQFTRYNHRAGIGQIKDLEIKGNVNIHRVQFEVHKMEFQVAAVHNNPAIDSAIDVPFGNMKWRKVLIAGEPGGSRFSINFMSKGGDNLYHFNPRKGEDAIVQNTNVGGWGKEERYSGYPFHQGVPYLIEVKVLGKFYKVEVNGKEVGTYDHRSGDGDNIHHIIIRGDTKINRVIFR